MGFLAPTTKVSTSQGQTSEFAVTASEYDRDIPIVFGSHRIGGNVIWADEIREEKVTDVQTEGGKGGPKVETTSTTFRYYVHLAVMFCEGPADAVTRIWADGKLIYNTFGAADTSIGGLKFRFYRGTDTQLPDSLIESFVGENNTPAYRGRCYIVFEDLPLADFGNRIPSLTAEISTSGGGVANVQGVDNTTNGGVPNTDTSGANAYTAEALTGSVRDVRFDDVNGEIVLSASGHAAGALAAFRINMASRNVRVAPSNGNTVPSVNLAVRGVREGRDEHYGPPAATVGSQAFNMARIDFATNTPDTAARARILDGVGWDTAVHFGVVGAATNTGDTDAAGYLAYNFNTEAGIGSVGRPSGFNAVQMVKGRRPEVIGANLSEAFGCFASTNQYRVVQCIITDLQGGGNGQANFSVVANITPDVVVQGASSWDATPAMAADRLTGRVFFQSLIDSTPYVWCYDINTNTVPWRTQVAFIQDGSAAAVNFGDQGQASLREGSWVWSDGSGRVIRVRLSDGQVDGNLDGSAIIGGVVDATPSHWHDPTSTLVTVVGGDVYFNRFTFQASGADINPRLAVETICLRAGLAADEIDVSQLPTSQSGLKSLLVSERQTAANAIGPLLTVLQYQVSETDFVLKFTPKSSSAVSVATISEDDFIETNDNEMEAYARVFADNKSLPGAFEVTYDDYDNDFQQGQQRDQRADNSGGRKVGQLRYNGAGTSTLFRPVAQIELYAAWAERERLRSRLPQRYLSLDPGDVVTLQLETGEAVTGRLRKADIGADFTVDFEQIVEETGQFVSTLPGASGDGLIRTEPSPAGDSEVFLFDTTLLRDVDSAGQEASVTYWAASGEPRWSGAVIYKETGISSIENFGKTTADVAFGTLSSDLSDYDGRNVFQDEAVDLIITRGAEQFASASDLDVLNGANALLVENDDGDLETVQFADAVQTGPVTVTVSRLLRGRRGTEQFARNFSAGNRVFLASTSRISAFSQSTDTLNGAQAFRGVTIGQIYEDAETQFYTDTGKDLKPYAPVHLNAEDDGASGFDLSWTRRTRVGGETDLAISGDIPLSEQTEAYEVDILDGPGGSVLRTLTSTTPSVNYSAAQITTDFGSTPASINVVVYQISAVVGRGFPAAATLSTS